MQDFDASSKIQGESVMSTNKHKKIIMIIDQVKNSKKLDYTNVRMEISRNLKRKIFFICLNSSGGYQKNESYQDEVNIKKKLFKKL